MSRYIIEYHSILLDILTGEAEAIEGADDPQELANKLSRKVGTYDYAVIYFMNKDKVMQKVRIRLQDYGEIPDEQGRQNYKVNLCL